jgi:Lrp/AsnC family transcriptional regulator for asnA, asnC and gidA
MARKHSRRNLDSTDLRLIAELETNPRQSYINLATRLGIDQTTVKRRFNRLLREGFIAFESVLNTAAVGYRWAMLGLNVSPGYSESIANELARHTLMYVTIASGRYDIMAWATYKDPEMLFNFISGDLGKIPNITSIETFPALKVLKYSFTFLGNANYRPLSSKMNQQFDECDWNILAELEENPRITKTHLARKLGISRQTTGARLQRLIDEDAVRINCVVSPAMIGYELSLGIFLKARPKSVLDVAERLTANRSVNAAVAISGRFDLMAFATFKSPDEMSDFLINELGTLPGIMSSETVFINMSLPSNPLSVRNARLYLQNQGT